MKASFIMFQVAVYFDGLVQACSISIANPLEILQSCIKPSIYALQDEKQPEALVDSYLRQLGVMYIPVPPRSTGAPCQVSLCLEHNRWKNS